MNLVRDTLDTVILASGVNRIPLFEGYEPGYKALIPFHGRASIQYVLDALQRSECIGRICIVGPQAILARELRGRQETTQCALEEGGETLVESVMTGLNHFRGSPAVLVASADIPLITSGAVRDFVSACKELETPYEHNLYVSAVAKEYYTGAYMGFTKPFNRYRDVTGCHGNLFIADPGLLDNRLARERINRIYAGRKNAFTAAMALGLDVAIVYIIGVEILHLITLRQMASYASRRFGFGVVPVLVGHPEITIDVDEPDDYEFVLRLMGEQQKRLRSCG